MVEAIFFDVDGTLVSFKNHQIPQSVWKALRLLKDKGIKLFVATGRDKDGLHIFDDFMFDGYITLNGQYCYDNQGNLLYENAIDKEDLKKLIDYVDTHRICCGFTEEFDKYYNFRSQEVEDLHAITNNDNHPVCDIHRALDNKVYQVQVFVDKQQEKELLALMPKSTSARWYPTFCDISPMGGNKENGIRQLCKHYKLNLDNTMAFGDGGNDLEMLKCVGISVAMKEANEELKEIADYVTDAVEDDGIYNALKHFKVID